ncbi:MAG: HlyC/CorC family transporter [Lachnospiraceae bacterium]
MPTDAAQSFQMDQTSWIQLIIIIVLLILSAFFSSAETAFSTVNQIRMENLAEEGNKKAKLVIKILSAYSKMLSTILIGNNIVNIVSSSLVTIFASKVFGSWSIGIATGALTVFVLLFGEIIPKTWAKLNNEKLTLAYAPAIHGLSVILTPVIFLVDKLSNAILRLLGIDPNRKVISITESELLSYVDAGHEEGVIESEEKEMIYNLFDFSDSLAKDIMIPRIDMVEIDIHASYEELLTAFRENMYTRIPVYENTPDNIVGVVNIKDMILIEDTEKFKIRKIMRDVYYTYEYKKTPDLLNEMREKSASISIVLNEYGAAEGMITMEDLLEEIVGEIRDEYDEDEKELLQCVGDREYLIEGSMKLDDINDQLMTDLHSDDYDSIGGIVIEHLDDRLPSVGEEVCLEDGTTLRVERFENNRIQSVRLKLPKAETDNSTQQGDDDTDTKKAPTDV